MTDDVLERSKSDERIDEQKVMDMAGKVVGDIAGAMSLFMAYLGDQAGVYEVLDGERLTCGELAEKTGLNAKYLHEWLGCNAAAGYVSYDAESERFWLEPEQALVFTREGQPACMQGFIQALMAQFETHETAVDTFKSGKGRGWDAHSPCCFFATDRFFRPGYAANLTSEWIPALGGVEDKLRAGAKVADIGCGLGSSTIQLAKTYPNSTIHGFDFHAESIKEARKRAKAEGVDNIEFHVAKAQDFEGEDFDFACIFDALHDMGDPVNAARHIRETLKADGTFMLVEPLAGDQMKDNLNPIGQIFYGFSTTICTPASLDQEVGLGLGAQAGQKRLTEVLEEAGFKNVRRAAETQTNMVLEVTA